ISGMVALVVVRSEDLGLPAGAPVAAERDGDRSEEWLQYLDAFDEQCGDPDMTRYVVLSSIRAGDETGLAGDIGAIRSWSDTLRRYHRRRIL
ncbi:MAG: hypothetical protein JXM71_11840, partial [Spirochaetales bacterium]|nr:hypothetical protein [Spirochaetales bacterium]